MAKSQTYERLHALFGIRTENSNVKSVQEQQNFRPRGR